MRLTIHLPDDIHQKIAVDALKKRRNSKEVVITEILRAHYGGGQPSEKQQGISKTFAAPPSAAGNEGDLRLRRPQPLWPEGGSGSP